MIKHTIEISQKPAYLSVRHDQLQIRQKDGDGDKTASVACEDIGVLILDHPQITCSHAAMSKVAEAGAAVIVCGRDHLPAAVLLPMANHSELVHRQQDQINISRPVRKRLWQQIVTAKVLAQSRNLHPNSRPRRKLKTLSQQVRSGDPTNIEAQAARIYWSAWLGENQKFKRDADGDGINALLNYGYAVLRAGIARAIVGAGLIPSLGIHHCNRSNAFCLADDLVEPLRPLVDHRIRQLYDQSCSELNVQAKKGILELLADPVCFDGTVGPLMVALPRYIASLVRCFNGGEKVLEIPLAVIDQTQTTKVQSCETCT